MEDDLKNLAVHAVDSHCTPSVLDFLDRFPHSHTFDCGRHSDHVTAAVRMLLKVVNFTKFTVMLQLESKCLFIKGVKVLLS